MNRALTVTLPRLRRWTPNPREHLFSDHLNKPIEENEEPKINQLFPLQELKPEFADMITKANKVEDWDDFINALPIQ